MVLIACPMRVHAVFIDLLKLNIIKQLLMWSWKS